MSIKVLLADDHDVYLDGLRLLLKKEPTILVVGSAVNGRDLVAKTGELQPDIVLTDIVMPVVGGIEATRLIRERFPDTGIIALSMFGEENMIAEMLEAGALGYLVKNASKTEIIEAIKTVYNGQAYYCRVTTGQLASIIKNGTKRAMDETTNGKFTETELRIIRYSHEGKTSIEIGNLMFMSSRTIEGLRKKIYIKMKVRTLQAMSIYAIKHKLIQKL